MYFQQPSRATQFFFYLMIVDNFFWCIFACSLRFSALSILANVILEPVAEMWLSVLLPKKFVFLIFLEDETDTNISELDRHGGYAFIHTYLPIP